MPTDTSQRFVLLYASQTGQAKAIAEEIHQQCSDRGLQPELHCLSMTDKKFTIEKERCAVFVSSTTGDGEPPDTALKFMRRLNKKTLADDWLNKLNYTILGLGDTNYTNFCNNAKNLDRRLGQLGAKHFYTPGFADEAVGLEVVVDPWIEGLFAAIKSHLDGRPHSAPLSPSNADISPRPTLNKDTATSAELSSPKQGDSNVSEKENLEPSNKSSNPSEDKSNVSERTKEGQDVPGHEKTPEDSRQTQTNTGSETVNDAAQVNGLSSSENQGPGLKDGLNSGTALVAGGASESADHSVLTAPCFLELNAPPSDGPSLGLSDPPLSEKSLTLPVATPPYLTVQYGEPDEALGARLAALPWQNGCKPPSAASEIIPAAILSAQRLTAEDAGKKTLLLRLSTEKSGLQYRPGDAISVVCANRDQEVSQLIARLGLSEHADLPLTLGILKDTKKRRAVVPTHIPEEGATLRHVLKHCVDIREPPKKALLRLLVDFTSDAGEQRRLQELSSKEGADHYASFVRGEAVSLLDVLYTFTSCRPPIQRILEHLPRLQPRPYSACSCQDWRPGTVDIAFNVVLLPPSPCRLYPRPGLCTAHLDHVTQPLQHAGKGGQANDADSAGKDDLTNDAESKLVAKMESVSLDDLEIQIFARTNQHFHHPSDLSVPLIMIGPGTGVAPFIGFLQERQLRLEKEGKDTAVGESWLFFGCRHEEKDFLFRQEIAGFQKTGTLSKFLPAFSRDSDPGDGRPRYVQDSVRAHSAELCRLIQEKEAVVFVCGDAQNMAKDVNAAFEEMMIKEKGLSADEAKTYVMKMRIHKRYLEDVWT